MRSTLGLFLAVAAAPAQMTVCQPTPSYSPCEIAFEMSPQSAAAHPHPYLTVQLDAEFRSPRFRTFRVPAFWDGGRRFVIRVSPTDPGAWIFRVSSNVAEFNEKEGQFSATESPSPGFLKPANVHHWAFIDENTRTPHLWMGDTAADFPFLDRGAFDQLVAARAGQKFTHLRGVVLAKPGSAHSTYTAEGEPDPAAFQELDSRIRDLNAKGIIADLVLAWDGGQLTKLFPSREERERYIRYLAARYAAMNITWGGLMEFETYRDGRMLLKELGRALRSMDPYQHPRTSGARQTSAPLLNDEWMSFAGYGAADDQLGSIEHQLFGVPFVNFGLGGASDADAFRHRLWNSTMDGQYPSSSAADPASAAAKQMAVWYDFFAGTRHWELEPYFDVDGGRAVALEGVEYIVYVEKPGPVEVLVEKHGYDVFWVNPANGESIKVKKGYKGDHFSGEPPDKSHDWVLHISREGRKEGMLRSYKFESRPLAMQEIEANPQKAPFTIAEPAGDSLSRSKPAIYQAKITRETRATRTMMFLWTLEAGAEQQGFRVIGTGAEGTFHIPADVSTADPADVVLRLYGMNAMGKVYQLLKAVRLTR